MSKLTVLDLIQASVALSPQKVAIICDKERITYAELDAASNNFAFKLIQEGVGQGDFVILYAQKSVEMVVAIVSCLKVGCVYVPVDVRYPKERIEYIINDCKPKAILSYKTQKEAFNIPDIPIQIDILSKHNFIIEDITDRVDYCIYTSGTTGKPKGVLIRDYSVVNLVIAYEMIYGMVKNDVVLQFASIAFDQSVWDIFVALGLGCSLCVVPQKYIEDIFLLEKYMRENKVTVAALTPAYLRELHPENLPDMRAIESGGAAVERSVVKKWKKYCRVFNTYGPTEATVNALTYEISDDVPDLIPIGKPIINTKAYVMNDGKECADGEVGELCLSGIGLAKGYLNNVELTKEKFVEDVTGKGLLYRTGDLVKKNNEGEFVCIGRIDNQIKIRGFRIDLSEIECALSEICSNAVITEKNQLNDTIIVAFVCGEVDPKNIKRQLSEVLPDYMIPSMFIRTEAIPLTINGKVDSNKLHDLYLKTLEIRKSNCVAPKTDIERTVVGVLCQILQIDLIGLNDNYIALGGNSINAIRALSELRELKLQGYITDLLTSENIGTFCQKLTTLSSYPEKDVDDERVLSEIQNKYDQHIESISLITGTQMYMFKAYKNKKIGDNFLQYVYDFRCKYNYKNLQIAIALLFEQYDALSSRFCSYEGQVYQLTFSNTSVHLNEITVSSVDEMKYYMEKDVLKGFSYETDVLVRFTVFLLSDGRIKLLCSISHMIVDGWSMDLLQKSLVRNYCLLQDGMNINNVRRNIHNMRSGKISQFNKFVHNLDFTEATTYWNNYFLNCDSSIRTFPHDNKEESETSYHEIIEWINPDVSQKIRVLCSKLGITENTVFEYAYATLLFVENGERCNDILFTKVVSGRDIGLAGIESMVGTMINIIPQRVFVENDPREGLQKLNKKNIGNMPYDKFDFYGQLVNQKALMDYIQTMFIFCNYYNERIDHIVYEYDRDQDDIDLSLYIDSLEEGYRILLTCKRSAYSEHYCRDLLVKFENIFHKFLNELFDNM